MNTIIEFLIWIYFTVEMRGQTRHLMLNKYQGYQ